MKEQMKDTKKALEEFLQERMKWFIDNANPFQEATMVSYIMNGLNELHNMNIAEDKIVIMYDENNELKFKEEA